MRNFKSNCNYVQFPQALSITISLESSPINNNNFLLVFIHGKHEKYWFSPRRLIRICFCTTKEKTMRDLTCFYSWIWFWPKFLLLSSFSTDTIFLCFIFWHKFRYTFTCCVVLYILFNIILLWLLCASFYGRC